MPLFRKTSAKLAERGIDPRRLPPGQYLTEKWPVLHAGSVPRVDLATYRFQVRGEVRTPISLTFDELRALPATDVICDIHCVTTWSRFDVPWRGVSFATLAAIVEPLESARFAVSVGLDGGYTANLPLSALVESDSLIAFEADGGPLTAEHGGPVRLMVPSRYFWKSTKWLNALVLAAYDRPGFWEERGYHNDADPFLEERYGF